MGVLRDVGPRTQTGEGADPHAVADGRLFDMAEGQNLDVVADRHTGTEHHVWADGDVAAQPRVERQEHAGRVGQGRPCRHRQGAQADLHQRLGHRQVGAGVDAQHLFGRRLDDGAVAAVGTGQGDHVGQIVLALGVVVADPVQPSEQAGSVDGHDAGIAQIDAELLGRRVAGLADGLERTVRPQHQPPVGRRIVGPEPEHHHRRCRIGPARHAHGLEGFRRDQRRIAEDDEHVALETGQGFARRQNGMGGAQPRLLHDAGMRGDGLGHAGGVAADDNDDLLGTEAFQRRHDMADHRQAGDGVQNLRFPGFHTRAEARGENDGSGFLLGHLPTFV